MRGVKRGQGSTGRVKKHRYSHEFKVTAVKMATAADRRRWAHLAASEGSIEQFIHLCLMPVSDSMRRHVL